MPLYEYFCKNCDGNFTVTMTIAEHEKKNIKCPKCKGTKVVPQFLSKKYKDMQSSQTNYGLEEAGVAQLDGIHATPLGPWSLLGSTRTRSKPTP